MKPLRLLNIFASVIPAATAGYLAAKVLASNGGKVPVSGWNLVATLAAISIILAIYAVPMFRYRHALAELVKKPTSPRPKRLNPFYAVRLVLLAKATAISGALFTGWHIGVIWMQLTSPVTPDSIWQNVVALVISTLMIVVGVIVERNCRIHDDGAEGEANSANSPAIGSAAPTASKVSAANKIEAERR